MGHKCRLIIDWMAEGHIHPDDLTIEQSEHLRNCKDCKSYYMQFIETEKWLKSHVENDADSEYYSRLRERILSAIDRHAPRRFQFFSISWLKPAAALAGIVFFIFLVRVVTQPGTSHMPSVKTFNKPVFDENLIETVYYETVSLHDLDESLLSDALASTIDIDVLDQIDVNSITPDNDDIYDDDYTEMLESLTQEDWQELRRYLS